MLPSTILIILAHWLSIASEASSFLQGDKIACSEEGKFIKFAFLEQDPCIMCQCRNGTVDCYKNNCREDNILQHSTAESSPKPIGLKRRSCFQSGRSFQNTETWIESCRRCTCTNGHVKCIPISANNCPQPKLNSCPAGQELQQNSDDNCCPKCVLAMLNTSPAIPIKQQTTTTVNALIPQKVNNNNNSNNKNKATVFGTCSLDERNHVRTFDGYRYPLIGKCNYAFVRDCSSTKRSMFSLHLAQKYQSGRNLLLRLRLRDKVIYFSHLGRVRINKQLIKLPYLEFGQFSIVHKNNEIRFKAMFGLEIKYTVNKTIEIKVKNNFENKLCGLCGNFNNRTEDDLMAKRSRNVVDLERFLYSYKVGKTPYCPRGIGFRPTVSEPTSSPRAKHQHHNRRPKNSRKKFINNQKQPIPLQSRQIILYDTSRMTKYDFRRRYPIGMI